MHSSIESLLIKHFKLPQKWSEFSESEERKYMDFVHPFLLFYSNLIDRIPDIAMNAFVMYASYY